MTVSRRPSLLAILLGGVLLITVAPRVTLAATPGEATELLVTGYDAATGDISISYVPACSAVDHHIEFGRLEDVAIFSYSGQVCGIGSSGSYGSLNPGLESYFFLVVGDDGIGIEGSYGTSQIGGAPVERPEDLLDPVCGFAQDLSQRCDGPFTPALSLTVFRPVTGSSGAPFQRWQVPDGEDLLPGAGIRVNGDDDDNDGVPDRDDVGVGGENDLVEILLTVDPPTPPPGFEYILFSDGGPPSSSVRVWNEPGKINPVPNPLSFPSNTRTVWVESPYGGATDLHFAAIARPSDTIVASDRVHFVPFSSVVIALGGEGQVPADPPLEPANHGMFQLAVTLYRMGYDVHMYDEDVVPSSGAGAAYNEVVSAIQRRAVTHVAIYGYSHGGGSTNDLARRLDANRATIGAFSIDFTGYVDAIDNDSDFDIDTETALPPSTGYHANYYEHPGCGFLQLCGGPIAGANLNVNVTATPWGSGLTHFTIDDAPEVLQGMLGLLVAHVVP